MCEQKKKQQEYLLREGSVKKALFHLGVPSIISMLVTAFYNFVDTYFIGILDNTDTLSSVSLTMPFSIILGSIGVIVELSG